MRWYELAVGSVLIAGCQAHGGASARLETGASARVDASARDEAEADAKAEVRLTEIIKLVEDRLDYEGKEIDFEYNKADVRGKDSDDILTQVHGILEKHPELKIHIEGHADSRGDDTHNLRLSKDRAAAVRDWFIRKGIAADRLTSDGYGEDQKQREPEHCRDKTGPDDLFKNQEDCLKAWHENRHTVFKVVEGLTALRPTKEPKADPVREKEPDVPKRSRPKIFVGAMIAKDFAFFPADDVCGQQSQHDKGFTCIRRDDEIYHGSPIPNADNTFGSAPYDSNWRLMGAIELVLGSQATLGGRLGYSFGGGPKSGTGDKFQPLHAEARLSFWFLRDSFTRPGLRPFAFISGGMAQVDTTQSTSVSESVDCSTAGAQGYCPVVDNNGNVIQYNPQWQRVDAWHRTGKGFLGLGLGSMYAWADNHGPVLELKLSRMMSGDTWVLSPGLGYLVGF